MYVIFLFRFQTSFKLISSYYGILIFKYWPQFPVLNTNQTAAREFQKVTKDLLTLFIHLETTKFQKKSVKKCKHIEKFLRKKKRVQYLATTITIDYIFFMLMTNITIIYSVKSLIHSCIVLFLQLSKYI